MSLFHNQTFFTIARTGKRSETRMARILKPVEHGQPSCNGREGHGSSPVTEGEWKMGIDRNE